MVDSLLKINRIQEAMSIKASGVTISAMATVDATTTMEIFMRATGYEACAREKELLFCKVANDMSACGSLIDVTVKAPRGVLTEPSILVCLYRILSTGKANFSSPMVL